jgi:hypothetical protein
MWNYLLLMLAELSVENACSVGLSAYQHSHCSGTFTWSKIGVALISIWNCTAILSTIWLLTKICVWWFSQKKKKQVRSVMELLHANSWNCYINISKNLYVSDSLVSICIWYCALYCSYKHAEDYQLRVIAAYESCGPDMSYEQREARRLLEQLRKKAEGSPHAVFPANSLPVLPQNRE